MGHINIEIKAKTSDQDGIRSVLKSLNAEYKGTDHQVDTYFAILKGKLKLREGNIENYLIHYSREDIKGPKQSNVILYKTSPGSSLKDILMKSIGAKVVVDKKREIYFIKNVKFHIDDVKGLGHFVEIEAIDKDGTIGRERLLEQCSHYMELLKISQDDLVSASYSDLLLRR